MSAPLRLVLFDVEGTQVDSQGSIVAAMIDTARGETGVSASNTVMVGDTRFDMDMARAAGVPSVGVTWGYHDRSALDGATCVIETFDQLPQTLDAIWT